MEAANITLDGNDARKLIACRMTVTVKYSPGFRWWMFRIRLAVWICRFGTWVGGQQFMKEVEK
jgi:hypothetical protein